MSGYPADIVGAAGRFLVDLDSHEPIGSIIARAIFEERCRCANIVRAELSTELGEEIATIIMKGDEQ